MSAPNPKRAALQQAESLLAAGVRQLPVARPIVYPAPGAVEQVAPQPTAGPPARGPQQQTEPPQSLASQAPGVVIPQASPSPAAVAAELPEISSAPSLEALRQEVAACTLCQELASTRTQTVFGAGAPSARLCFLGEAPGADEDQQGEPFVGRAGQLLTKIIEACHMQREEVYILNVLKCRPPGNRNPAPAEAANCSRLLNRQLELIDPEFICCLGAVAAQNLLKTTTAIGRLRGQVHDYRGIQVVCTYHPAYLLRNPAAKKDTWEDMKMLMGLMGVEL